MMSCSLKLLGGSIERERFMVSAANQKPIVSGRRHSARATYTPSVLSQMEARLKKSEDELHSTTASLKKFEEEVHATREELKATKEELSTRIASLEALITASSSSRTPPPCT